MPLVEKRQISEDIHLGIWEITEDVDYFLSQVTLTPNERMMFNGLGSDTRKIQWLSYRLIIKRLLNLPYIIDIVYDNYGRPRILDQNYRISVSHSGSYAIAVISQDKLVGVDIEKIHPRIEKVIHKFMNRSEREDLMFDFNIEHMHVCWSAKEALYKLYGRRQLDFKDNIHLGHFIYDSVGSFTGSIITDAEKIQAQISYDCFKGHIIALAIEE